MKRRDLLTAFTLPVIGTLSACAAQPASPLKVGAALPDPPFEFMTDDVPAGFDIALMKQIAQRLGREWQLVPYTGADFNDIFGGLSTGTYDCIASGTTITPEREQIVDFCAPYVVSGQSLVVDFKPSSQRAGHRGPQGPCNRRTAWQHESAGRRKTRG